MLNIMYSRFAEVIIINCDVALFDEPFSISTPTHLTSQLTSPALAIFILFFAYGSLNF